MGVTPNIWDGLIGLSKVVFGIDRSASEVVAQRNVACKACPRLRPGKLGPVCDACGCYAGPKAKIAGQGCPEGKW